MVDLHFGHASDFLIYQVSGDDFQLLETRKMPKYCTGPTGCDEEETDKEAVASALSDCDAVLTMRIGSHARDRLGRHGVRSVEACYTVEHGLKQAAEELQKENNIQ
ncbi:MAG: NifB/NifX family molybdenum-iron cluster-binding protein [Negativicutes bacterium]|nr:NifB/NifX family molybdenum-iron cluster-binding protein [Negativicutes bacterium]